MIRTGNAPDTASLPSRASLWLGEVASAGPPSTLRRLAAAWQRTTVQTDKYYAFLDQFILSGSRFIIAVAIARLSSLEVYAAYYLLSNLDIILSLLVAGLISRPVSILLPGMESSAGRRFLAGCLHATLGTAATTTCLCVIAGLCLGNIGGATIAAFGLFTLMNQPQQVLSRAAVALFRARTACIADFASTVLTVGGLLAAHRLHGITPMLVFQLLAAGQFLGCLILLLSLGGEWRVSPAAVREAVRQAWPIGKYSCAGSLANSLCSRLHPYILALTSGTQAVAFFGVLMTMAGPIRVLAGGVEMAMLPRFRIHLTRDMPDRARHTLRLSLTLLLGLCTLACVPLMIWPAQVLHLIFKVDYAGCGWLLRLSLLYTLLTAGITLVVGASQCLGLAKEVFMLRLQVLVVALVIAWPAMQWLSVLGAVATLLSVELLYLTLLARTLILRGRDRERRESD